MLAAAALLALAQAPTGLDCSFLVGEREAEIGQPIRCELIVKHPLDTRVNVDLESLLPSDAWFLLEEPELLVSRHTEQNQRQGSHTYYGSITSVEWTIAALEPGAHTVLAPPVMCEIDGVAQVCDESSHAVVIEAALLPDEDAPRPPARPALPTAEEESRYVSPLWFLLLPGGLLVLAFAWRLARRTRTVDEAPARPAREQLVALDLELPPKDYCRVLRDRLRDAFDERAGKSFSGLTDEEWLARFDAGDAQRERLAELLATCEAVRFGGQSLTRFAIVDLQREALDLAPAAEVPA
jgi:hypothetical protein